MLLIIILQNLVDQLFVAESFDANFALAIAWGGRREQSVASGPEGNTKAEFVRWVQELPEANPPSWLGRSKCRADHVRNGGTCNMLCSFTFSFCFSCLPNRWSVSLCHSLVGQRLVRQLAQCSSSRVSEMPRSSRPAATGRLRCKDARAGAGLGRSIA